MWAGAELEHHRSKPHPLDGGTDGLALLRELTKGRTHEHPEKLVGGPDEDRAAVDPGPHVGAGRDAHRTCRWEQPHSGVRSC